MAEKKPQKKSTIKKATTKKTVKAPSKPKEKVVKTNDVPKDSVITAGDKRCYCYVDVNLTANSRLGQIISIGAVDYDGNTFYGEITDYNKDYVSDDVKDTVITHLIGEDHTVFNTVIGTFEEVRDKFLTWLNERYDPTKKFVQFVMDKVSWDWPIFMEFVCPDLSKLPDYISPVVNDINADLANAVTVDKSLHNAVANGEGSYNNFIPALIVSREINRIDSAESIGNLPDLIMLSHDSNSLKKAVCIRSLHQNLWGFNIDAKE